MFTIRRAKSGDENVIAGLSRQSFFETYHAVNSVENMNIFLEENFNDEVIETEVNDANNIFIIGEADGISVAYAKLSENVFGANEKNDEIEICRIYCLKKAIGKGFGKAMMDECIAIGKQRQKRFIVLGVWEKMNGPSPSIPKVVLLNMEITCLCWGMMHKTTGY